MTKKKTNKNTLLIAILTFITVLCWIGFETYRAVITPQVTTDIRQRLTPLNPELDTSLIDNLARRQNYTLEEVRTLVEITPSPPNEVTPTAGEIETEEEATSPATELTPAPEATD